MNDHTLLLLPQQIRLLFDKASTWYLAQLIAPIAIVKRMLDSLLKLGQDVPLTGGFVFDLPVGKIYSKNITPDKETGIGDYTDAEIARALRYGVHADGTVVYDFMPFHNMSR